LRQRQETLKAGEELKAGKVLEGEGGEVG
jgi:hypothetical protein